MTEVLKSPVSFSTTLPKTGPVLSVKHYEAKAPANLSSQLVSIMLMFSRNSFHYL